MKLQLECKRCSKPLILTHEMEMSSTESLHFYKCGHFELKVRESWPHISPEDTRSFENGDSKFARDYQMEGITFGYDADLNCIITDQVGLGKTMQVLQMYRHAKEKLGKCLIVVKSATLYQWVSQYKLWCDPTPFGCYIIQGTKGIIPEGFDTYIISMDTFGRMVRINNKTKSMYDYATLFTTGDSIGKNNVEIAIDQRLLAALEHEEGRSPFLIVDECQSFKDPSSARTKALVGFCKQLEIEHKVFLSATPIKNRADEYFIPLNLCRPTEFPSLDQFRRQWLMKDSKNRYSRVSPYRLDEFREMLSHFVLRRETKDVLKDLPPFRREFEIVYIEDDKMKQIYNQEVDKLRITLSEGRSVSWQDVQANLMMLRRITGIAKIDFAVEYIDTFLETSENEKIAIGVWHTDVRDILYGKLSAKGIKCLKLSGEDNAQKKMELVRDFHKPENRVMVINLVAGGVGIDGLEVCNNVIGLERAWNSVDEEQFEGRFGGARQAQSGLPVYAEYWIAKDTVDEDLHDMIEHKRKAVHEVVDNDWSIQSDSNFLRELLERTVSRKRL